MRTTLRLTATLLLTIAVVWIGFDVWLFFSTVDQSTLGSQLLLLPVGLALNAWPAFVLIAVAVALARLHSLSSHESRAS